MSGTVPGPGEEAVNKTGRAPRKDRRWINKSSLLRVMKLTTWSPQAAGLVGGRSAGRLLTLFLVVAVQ